MHIQSHKKSVANTAVQEYLTTLQYTEKFRLPKVPNQRYVASLGVDFTPVPKTLTAMPLHLNVYFGSCHFSSLIT